jgi:WD40 repeat protein
MVVAALCQRGHGTAGLTTILQGSGGFGKTKLARVACANQRLRQHFQGRVYFITLGGDVRSRAALAGKIAEITRWITGDNAQFTDPEMAGDHLAALLSRHPSTLLVLDDVWEDHQLAPFLRASATCTLLVTTRNPRLLPSDARRIDVDQMSLNQARQVLTAELPDLPEDTLQPLLAITGRWPLLLRTTNRLIRAETTSGLDAEVAANSVLQRLRSKGPAAVDDQHQVFDVAIPAQREKAVRATIEAATRLLPGDGAARYAELGIFAEDEAVPQALAVQLWQATAEMSPEESRALCRKMAELALLTISGEAGGRIALHDVYRSFLQGELGPGGLSGTSAALVDALIAALPRAAALASTRSAPIAAWWQTMESYVLDHAVEHLLTAGHGAEAEALAGDIRWIEARLHQRGSTAPWSDLLQIPTSTATQAAQDLARASYLLLPTDPPQALTAILHSRLEPLPLWHDQITARQAQPGPPALVNAVTPPDLPNPALQRALAVHCDALAISPDGLWLATGSFDGAVRIWNRTTGDCTATLVGHTGLVSSLAISPDATRLASASYDKTVRIWDCKTGTCIKVLEGHAGLVLAVAVSPDGTWLATASLDGTVRIWDSLTGECAATYHARAEALAISPDGTWLATAGHEVRIWDRLAGTCTATATNQTGPVNAVAISPDGTWLATANNDRTVQVWDRATADCIKALRGHADAVSAVAISPDGTWLATASCGHEEPTAYGDWEYVPGQDTAVRIWDPLSGSCLATLTGHTEEVGAVAISPDGTWLATASRDGTVRIWDRASAEHGNAPRRPGDNRAVAISPDSSWLATGGLDKTVRIWDRATAQCIKTLWNKGQVHALAVSPDGTWLAAASNDKTVRIWDVRTGTCTATLTGHTRLVLGVAVSPDGTWLATVSTDKTARIWDVRTGTCTATLTGHTNAVSAVAISPDGTWLATSSDDKTVRIWDRATARCIKTLRSKDKVYAVAISRDGTWLAAAGGAVQIWDPLRGTCVATLAHHANFVYAVAISPDSTRLVGADGDGLLIWGRQSGAVITHTLEAAAPAVTTSPGASLLAAAGTGNAENWVPITRMRTDAMLWDCAWAADGHTVAAVGVHGLYLYNYRL